MLLAIPKLILFIELGINETEIFLHNKTDFHEMKIALASILIILHLYITTTWLKF